MNTTDGGADDKGNQSDGDSDDDRDSAGSDDDEDGSGDDDEDDDSCPVGCDLAIYEKVPHGALQVLEFEVTRF